MAKANITIEFLGASRYLASGKSIDLWTLRHTLQQQGDGGIYSLILKVGEYDEPIDGLEKVELLWFGGKCLFVIGWVVRCIVIIATNWWDLCWAMA